MRMWVPHEGKGWSQWVYGHWPKLETAMNRRREQHAVIYLHHQILLSHKNDQNLNVMYTYVYTRMHVKEYYVKQSRMPVCWLFTSGGQSITVSASA